MVKLHFEEMTVISEMLRDYLFLYVRNDVMTIAYHDIVTIYLLS